jgi:hypothetical protein
VGANFEIAFRPAFCETRATTLSARRIALRSRRKRAPELELMISRRTARPRKRYVIKLAISCERHPEKMAPRMQVVVIAERQQSS